MVNRNAALHLLAVASVLLFSIVFIGYRLRDSAAVPIMDVEADAGLALRPDTVVDTASQRLMTVNDSASLKPPVSMTPIATPGGGLPDMDGGEAVPERGSMLRPGADNGSSLFLPPPGMPSAPSGSIEESATGSSLKPPSDGEITGLIPAPGSGLSLPVPGADIENTEFAQSSADDLGGGIPLLEARPGEEPEAAAGSSAFSGGGGLMLPVPTAGGQSNTRPTTESSARPVPPASAAPDGRAPGRVPGNGGTIAEQSSEPLNGDSPPPDNAGSRVPPIPPGRLTPSAQPAVGGISRPAASSGSASGLPSGDGDEELRIYVISQGDTLSRIAARELGSISRADNIYLLNKDVIVDPDQLVVGTKIRLPVREQIQGGRENVDEPAGPAILPGRAPRVAAGGGNARIHTVAGGDTLSSISLRYYGSSAGWRFLYEANADVLPNPNQLTVGTELMIPPYGERLE